MAVVFHVDNVCCCVTACACVVVYSVLSCS